MDGNILKCYLDSQSKCQAEDTDAGKQLHSKLIQVFKRKTANEQTTQTRLDYQIDNDNQKAWYC